ncbi:MAG: PrgI family protein [Bacillota bacterium]
MQQFTVPQFIDVESKIIGPITTRQFLIFLSTAIIIGLSYKLFDFALFLTIAIILSMIAGIFSFVKVNGRPFHFFILNFIQTFRRPKLRVWAQAQNPITPDIEVTAKPAEASKPKDPFQNSRLAELALVVDTKGRYRGEEGNN